MEVAHQHKTDTGGHQATFRSIILKNRNKSSNTRIQWGDKKWPRSLVAKKEEAECQVGRAAVSKNDFSSRIYLSVDYFSRYQVGVTNPSLTYLD